MNTSITHDPFVFPATLKSLYAQMAAFLGTVTEFEYHGHVFRRPNIDTPSFEGTINGRRVAVMHDSLCSISWQAFDFQTKRVLVDIYYTPFDAIEAYLFSV